MKVISEKSCQNFYNLSEPSLRKTALAQMSAKVVGEGPTAKRLRRT